MKRLVLGTRGSALALAQTGMVREALQQSFPELEMETQVIRTTGDQRLDVSLQSGAGLDKGMFTKELEEALAQREIDLAVHSLKDLPTGLSKGFVLGAILPREDPADLLISKVATDELPDHATIATGSPRRSRQLLTEHPDWQVCEIRGNVPTRLRKLQENPELDGIVLALAGLKRLHALDASLHWQDSAGEFADLRVQRIASMLPAPGQGAVAVEIRTTNRELSHLLKTLHCPVTTQCVGAERALLAMLGGGCHQALGALATPLPENRMILEAVFFPREGEPPLRAHVEGSRRFYRRLAEQICRAWKL